jgi:trehalose 6-phosphate phosphatase
VKNILDPANGAVLSDLARVQPLLVFDFDGTLAPIVSDPTAATMRPETRALLRVTALLYPCAVVSGRRRADVLGRLGGVPLVGVVGNHGAEAGFGPVDRSPRDAVEAWLEVLRRKLGALKGVRIEDKELSVAVHYRQAPARAAARETILAVARRLQGARVFGGRAVVNVVPGDAHDKGDAVARLLARASRRTAVFVGDDATDEDAFRHEAVGVGIRVGQAVRSAAEYCIPAQRDLDDLLRALVRARRRQDGLGADISGLERSMRELDALVDWRAC